MNMRMFHCVPEPGSHERGAGETPRATEDRWRRSGEENPSQWLL